MFIYLIYYLPYPSAYPIHFTFPPARSRFFFLSFFFSIYQLHPDPQKFSHLIVTLIVPMFVPQEPYIQVRGRGVFFVPPSF